MSDDARRCTARSKRTCERWHGAGDGAPKGNLNGLIHGACVRRTLSHTGVAEAARHTGATRAALCGEFRRRRGIRVASGVAIYFPAASRNPFAY